MHQAFGGRFNFLSLESTEEMLLRACTFTLILMDQSGEINVRARGSTSSSDPLLLLGSSLHQDSHAGTTQSVVPCEERKCADPCSKNRKQMPLDILNYKTFFLSSIVSLLNCHDGFYLLFSGILSK